MDPREQLIRAGFEAWEAGDVERVLSLYHPEIVVFAPPEIGNPGTFHGIDGFLEWSGAWFEAWESFHQDLLYVELVGERHALGRVRQTAVGKGSGIQLNREATYVYEISEGLLTYMSVYFDHVAAVADARAREAAG